MMNTRLNKALIALLAVATVGACDDPPIEPGNTDAARLATNPSFVVIEAGETRLVQAYLVNSLGNPVSGEVSYSACSALVTVADDSTQTDIEPGTNFTITGNTLGESCVNVSAGGFEETINVSVVPGSVGLTVSDTVESGSTSSSAVEFFDSEGSVVAGFDIDDIVFTTDDDEIAVVNDAGIVTGRAPGEVNVIATLDPGTGAARADTFAIVVVPGTFAGTSSGTTGPGGQLATFTFVGPGTDDDTEATVDFDGDVYPLYNIDDGDAATYVTRLPYGVAAGVGTVAFTGLGTEQVALGTTVEITSMTANDPHEPNDLFGVATPVEVPFDDILFQDGSDTEDRYAFTITDTTDLRFDLDWDGTNGSHDLDFILYRVNDEGTLYVSAGCSAATAAHPETAVCLGMAPDTYYIRINNYDADVGGAQGPTNYHLTVTIPEL